MKAYVTFKNPYVLIEDTKGKYRPSYKEYPKELPFINLKSPTLCCPFSRLVRPHQRPKKQTAIKSGYCEVCFMKYEDYHEHIISKGHIVQAGDSFNYRRIDEFIRELNAEDEGETYYGPLIESPCDRLEKIYAESNKYNYIATSDSESFIRFSKVSSTNGDRVLAFDAVIDNLGRKHSQNK
ncbi:hypothetical protein PAEPH01_1143 [Pancytospora epiphaga]|nr:hypothetical protein PAEPH01_1143 [Pancytospora epiphaga]